MFKRTNVAILDLDLTKEEHNKLLSIYGEALETRVSDLLDEYGLNQPMLDIVSRQIVWFMLYAPEMTEMKQQQNPTKRDVRADHKKQRDLIKIIDRVLKHLRSGNHNWLRNLMRAVSGEGYNRRERNDLLYMLHTVDGHFRERLEKAARVDDKLVYVGTRRPMLTDLSLSWREIAEIERETDQPFTVYQEIEMLEMPRHRLQEHRALLLDRMVALRSAVENMEELKAEEWSLHDKLIEAQIIEILAPYDLDTKKNASGITLVQKLCLWAHIKQRVLDYHLSPSKPSTDISLIETAQKIGKRGLFARLDQDTRAILHRKATASEKRELQSFCSELQNGVDMWQAHRVRAIGDPRKTDPYPVAYRPTKETLSDVALEQATQAKIEIVRPKQREPEEPESTGSGREAPVTLEQQDERMANANMWSKGSKSWRLARKSKEKGSTVRHLDEYVGMTLEEYRKAAYAE